MKQALICLIVGISLFAGPASEANAQRQKPDLEFTYSNSDPAFETGTGPIVTLLSINNSFVERGSMDPFANLAETDGFRVVRRQSDLAEALADPSGILVIANPYLPEYRNFPAMTPPSAFSDEQIQAIHDWVNNGGSLLILADHAPLGGGSSKLAEKFGFEYLNGHAANTARADAGYVRVDIEFSTENGLNEEHPITNGQSGRKPVNRYYAFGGQAFIPPPEAVQILTIPDGWSAIFTYRISAELQSALRIDASGMAQGAAMDYGKGRIAVFSEAGGFTSQIIDGTRRFGFNTEDGEENPELILSTLRWLAGFNP
ncbi:MAG: DUF4350 domain-containing protein [Pseudomonadota bacterium]